MPPLARKVRPEYAGAVYPVMACGTQGRDIQGDALWVTPPVQSRAPDRRLRSCSGPGVRLLR